MKNSRYREFPVPIRHTLDHRSTSPVVMTIDEDADIGEYYHEDDKVEYVQSTHYYFNVKEFVQGTMAKKRD